MSARNLRSGVRLLCLAVLATASGCINLPPALERELDCPAADQPDHFGTHDSCDSPVPHHSR